MADKGVGFFVEYAPNAKYVVLVQQGGGRLSADDTSTKRFVEGMQKTVPKSWTVQDAHLESTNTPTKDASKFTVRLSGPETPVFYSHGYVVPGKRTYMIVSYSADASEALQFQQFVSSFALLSASANALPPEPPANSATGIMMILAIGGAVADWRYKRHGGKKPTRRDHVYLWVSALLCLFLLIFLGVRGLGAEALGSYTASLTILIFAIWEVGRWRIRRKYPVPPPMPLTSPGHGTG
jgi:hypothetical protein